MPFRSAPENAKTAKPLRSSKTDSNRAQLSTRKTEIKINVYDLLPPGRLSTILWIIGSGLLHSGVVIGDREYAYGGHDRKGLTGVYYTKPRHLPPGGTWRVEILQGFTLCSPSELENVIREASDVFQGTSYNLLTKNCNHFTSYLCEKLTGRPAPKWLNRAAGIGVALPCVVPRDWITPPECDNMDGDLLEDDDDDESEDFGERSQMLGSGQERRLQRKASAASEEEWYNEIERIGRASMGSADGSTGPSRSRYIDEERARPVISKDSNGSDMASFNRAPLSRTKR
ncbi:uncharacterized protein PV09_02423 [Verruconis gallopava]|uniref:PPPDE domain-containing protein n=1 Tax=Verruconis gallopava TaxID=253628 RepID=A0A0D2B656_9PEZI|nr:uncharacterized protein PV09_02423 [Verruconis gallopava]KIW06729.1 hypothetical protein PV09_02423 [Verruconis gallopava]